MVMIYFANPYIACHSYGHELIESRQKYSDSKLHRKVDKHTMQHDLKLLEPSYLAAKHTPSLSQ